MTFVGRRWSEASILDNPHLQIYCGIRCICICICIFRYIHRCICTVPVCVCDVVFCRQNSGWTNRGAYSIIENEHVIEKLVSWSHLSKSGEFSMCYMLQKKTLGKACPFKFTLVIWFRQTGKKIITITIPSIRCMAWEGCFFFFFQVPPSKSGWLECTLALNWRSLIGWYGTVDGKNLANQLIW